MSLEKVYEGSEMMLLALQNRLMEQDIHSIIKDNPQSASIAGFGSSHLISELYVNADNLARAKEIIEGTDFL